MEIGVYMRKKDKIALLLIIIFLLPFTVDAAMCEKKQASTKYKFCLKSKPTECFETNADFPDDLSAYIITETKYCQNSNYELQDNLCIQTTNCTNESVSDSNNVSVELTTKSGVCNADASLKKDYRLELKVGQYSSCNGRIDLIEADGIMNLIESKTEKSRILSINQLMGFYILKIVRLL